MDLIYWVLLLAGGVAAGVVNTLAGGGTLITVPLLVLVGLSPNVANGTNRVAVLVQSVVATWAFHRRGYTGVRLSATVLPSGLVGAAIGAYLSTQLSGAAFRQIFGVAMLPLAALIFSRRKGLTTLGQEHRGEPKGSVQLAVAFFAVGAYAGFIQAGVGIIALAALTLIGGFDLRQGNAVKVFTVAVFTAVAVVFFALESQIALGHGLALAAATGLGGYLGTLAAVKRGDRWIRWAVVASCIGLSVKMILG